MIGTTMGKTAGKISEAYVVQYLLQSTALDSSPLAWYEKEVGGYVTTISGLHVELSREHSVVGSRVILSLCRALEKVYIAEPQCVTLSGRYRNEEARRLAELMRQLETAVAGQCSQRQARAPEMRERIKNTIFRQLLFQEPPE